MIAVREDILREFEKEVDEDEVRKQLDCMSKVIGENKAHEAA
jgi:hypothetical protein